MEHRRVVIFLKGDTSVDMNCWGLKSLLRYYPTPLKNSVYPLITDAVGFVVDELILEPEMAPFRSESALRVTED